MVLLDDLPSADHGGSRGALVLPSQGVRHDELAELLDEAVIAPEVVIALGRWRLEADLARFGQPAEVPRS